MTPKEIAEKIVTIDRFGEGNSSFYSVSIDRWIVNSWMTRGLANENRILLVLAVEKAIALYLASVVPEGPVGEEWLEMIRSRSGMGLPVSDRHDLLASYDHLRSLCARLMNDSDSYQAGLEQGRRQERRRHAEVLRKLEWEGVDWEADEAACVICGARKSWGHKDGCELASLLKEAPVV